MNLTQLHEMAAVGEKLVMLTSYDSTFAKLSEEAGVDIIRHGIARR
jgi:ketopantoate hydroxymethyltransferase